MTKPTGFLAVSIATCLSLVWLGCCMIVVGVDGGEDTGVGGSDVAPAGDNGDGVPPAGDNADSDGGGKWKTNGGCLAGLVVRPPFAFGYDATP